MITNNNCPLANTLNIDNTLLVESGPPKAANLLCDFANRIVEVEWHVVVANPFPNTL